MNELTFNSVNSYAQSSTRKYIYSNCPEVLTLDSNSNLDSDALGKISAGIVTLTYTLKPNEIVDVFLYTHNGIGYNIVEGVAAYPGSGSISVLNHASAINNAYDTELTFFNNYENADIHYLSPYQGTLIIGDTCTTASGFGNNLDSRIRLQASGTNTQDVTIAVFMISSYNMSNITNITSFYHLDNHDLINAYGASTGIYTYPLITIGNKQYMAIESFLPIVPGQFEIMTMSNMSNPNEFYYPSAQSLGHQLLDGNFGIVYRLQNVATTVKISARRDNQDHSLLVRTGNDSFWSIIHPSADNEVSVRTNGSDLYLVLPGHSNGGILLVAE